MKNKPYVLGLVALMLVSACAKKITGPQAEQAKGVDVGQTLTPEMLKKMTVAGVKLAANDLAPISNLDLKDIGGLLPFANSADKDNNIRNLGNPSFDIKGDDQPGFVKNSNVVFRGLVQVPADRALIKGVTKLELRLEGVRRYSDDELKDASLANQIICEVDAKLCSGIEPQSDRGNGFLGKSQSADFSDITGLKLTNALAKDKGRLYSYSTSLDGKDSSVLVIDLGKVLGLNETGLTNLIYDPAVSIPAAANDYRKLRFVIGNNVYFDKGSINIEFEWANDSNKPKNWGQAPGAVLKAGDDQSAVLPMTTVDGLSGDQLPDDASLSKVDPKKEEVKKEEPKVEPKKEEPKIEEPKKEEAPVALPSFARSISQEKLGITATSEQISDTGAIILENMAAVLGKQPSIVVSVDVNVEASASKEVAQARLDLISTHLTKLGLDPKAIIGTAKQGASTSVGILVKMKADSAAEDRSNLELALEAVMVDDKVQK